MSLFLCPRWRNKSDLFIYLISKLNIIIKEFKIESAVQGWDRVRRLSIRRPQQPASSTPSNTGSLGSFKRDTEMSTKVMGTESSTVRRRKRVPMNNYSAMNNTRWHIRQRQCNATLEGCIGLLLILNSVHNTATDRRWERLNSKTPPAKKTSFLTTLSSTLRCESAAEYHTDGQYYKTNGRSSKKISEGATDHEIFVRTFWRCQTSELQHWKQSEGASQNWFKHQTPLPIWQGQ